MCDTCNSNRTLLGNICYHRGACAKFLYYSDCWCCDKCGYKKAADDDCYCPKPCINCNYDITECVCCTTCGGYNQRRCLDC